MFLRLKYTGRTAIPVEIEGLTPAAVRGKPLSEIEKYPIFHGNQQLPLAELFSVSGDPASLTFEFEGDLAGVHWIGAGMTEGTIRVHGPAGRHVGSGMTGGEIHVHGDAGDWLGSELHGGLIHIRGNAGNLVGAAYRGSRKGMTGGTILVNGDVGDELGYTMRRGLIAVGGAAGDAPAFNMIAGSVLVFGKCGIRPAAGMRRGTLGLFGPNPPPLLPTFRRECSFRPPFLPLVFQELRRLAFPFDVGLATSDYTLYSGDLVTLGRGEVLIREN